MKIDKELYERVSKTTFTDYEPIEIINSDDGYYLEEYHIQSMLEDLLCEIDNKQETIEELERDIEDNYVPRKRSDYTGDSEDDRY